MDDRIFKMKKSGLMKSGIHMNPYFIKSMFLLLGLYLGWVPAFSFPYVIKKVGLEYGLSDNHIKSITQDKNGFIWFATEWGLNRFNGSRFEVYKTHPTDTNTINSNGLNKVLADTQNHRIWIATQRTGLNAFDCTTGRFIRYPISAEQPDGIGANGITDLCLAEDGNLWIGTYNNGLKKLDVRTNRVLHYDEKLPALKYHNIWSVTNDKNGHLYLGHVNEGMSVISLNSGKVKHFFHRPDDPYSLPSNTVFQVYIDSRGNVWLATEGGLALYHPDRDRFTVFRHQAGNPASLIGNEVYCIREMKDGNLWIGTLRGGISILDIRQTVLAAPEEVCFRNIGAGDLSGDLSNSSVTSLFQDSFGNIWIGTNGGGIQFISHQKPFFSTITYSPIRGDMNGLGNNVARALCIDRQNQLWIGTDEGIDLYKDGKKIKHFSVQDKNLPDGHILSALCDRRGEVWFGTLSGVVRYTTRNGSFERVRLTDNSALEQNVSSLYEDRDGKLWIGTNYRIIKYDPLTEEVQLLDGAEIGLWNNLIRTISQDRSGNIWIGTLINGISIITPDFKQVKLLNCNKGFYSNGINHIFRDSKGRMWIATRDGLVMCDLKQPYSKFRVLSQKDGIADDFVRSVAEGLPGEMWVSTNVGISRFGMKNGKIDNYTHSDNIPLGNFMSASVAKMPDGTLYFGSQDGVCHFNPRNRQEKYHIPDLRITGFSIYDTRNLREGTPIHIPVAPTMHLKYNQNTFTLEFNVMDYALNDQVEYSYLLDGINDSWHSTNGQRRVTFRDIPPGKYTFTVTARIRNQEWSGKSASVQIEIAPPFWLSWWAKTVYAILILLLLWSVARFYKRKLNLENLLYLEQENYRKEKELNDEKLRFYTNIAHELRTPLTLIIGPLADLMAAHNLPAEYAKKVSLIHRSATRLTDLINRILEFRKSETQNRTLCVMCGDLSGLIREIGLKYKELNQNPKIDVEVFIEADKTELFYDPEVITILLDNLISNALKYTREGRVEIRVRNVTIDERLYTEIEVSDTGRGIPKEELEKIFDRYYRVKGDDQVAGSGIGLSLVKNMVQLHQATIQVESQVRQGTVFRIRLQNDYSYPEASRKETKKPLPEEKNQSLPVLLIVEDDKEIREYIASSFEKNFEVWTAENGKEGLEQAFEKMPDVIVSDIMMPVMDGIVLCKMIKEDLRTCHIPVILLTAKDSLEDKTEGYSVGADSYITKPFTAQLLGSRIYNLLESRKKLAEAFAESMKDAGMKDEATESALGFQDNEFMEKTVTLVKENLGSEQMNVAFLAQHFCMSHSTYYRKVKALTGMSVNELIRKIKMQEAQQMLLSKKYTISEVAFRVGFSSMTHFRQSFKAEFGVLPSEI